MDGEDMGSHTPESTEYDFKGKYHDGTELDEIDEDDVSSSKTQSLSEMIDEEGLGRVPSEAQEYIFCLQSQLSYVKKELQEVRQKKTALQMQQFVGEEKNDLLDYLRSLRPDKVWVNIMSLKNKEGLALLKTAIEKAGYAGKVVIGMDVAASEFYSSDKTYDLNFKEENQR